MSDTSMVYEGTIRWGLDETAQGDAAGGGAFCQAPGRCARENGGRRPRKVRQPQTPPGVLQRILELREENPSWGREKLRVLLVEEGVSISARRNDRGIGRLKDRGLLREPALQRKSPRPHLRRLRRPRCLAVDRPGALVQMDSKQVRMANGKTVFEF